MAKATNATRAPRGTKILAKAFFAAADEIPEPQRAEVVKAALAAIRDELKTAREKAAAAKAKARMKTDQAPATQARKTSGAVRPPAKAVKKAGSVQAKPTPKRPRKAASPPTETAMPSTLAETDMSSDV